MRLFRSFGHMGSALLAPALVVALTAPAVAHGDMVQVSAADDGRTYTVYYSQVHVYADGAVSIASSGYHPAPICAGSIKYSDDYRSKPGHNVYNNQQPIPIKTDAYAYQNEHNGDALTHVSGSSGCGGGGSPAQGSCPAGYSCVNLAGASGLTADTYALVTDQHKIYVFPTSAIITHDGGSFKIGSQAFVIAQGGGNVIAQGGGNVIAQGGGNIVATGGGNLRTVLDTGGGAHEILAKMRAAGLKVPNL